MEEKNQALQACYKMLLVTSYLKTDQTKKGLIFTRYDYITFLCEESGLDRVDTRRGRLEWGWDPPLLPTGG